MEPLRALRPRRERRPVTERRRFRWAVAFAFILPLTSNAACEGVGTVVFFANGMFNTRDEAEASRDELEGLVASDEPAAPGKKLVFDVAYKRSEALFEQLLNVAKYKALDDIGRVWLWTQGIELAPDWFREEMETLTVKLTDEYQGKFERLRDHMEAYSGYVADGYNVILVSHSQGNFYANQAMRGLESYVDQTLSGSISDKGAKNPLYPKFSELVANVQVATPVTETVAGSPWTTFSDDLPMAAVRRVAGALPANVKTKGGGFGLGQDPLGHNFINAYLRVDESRNKILSEIKQARARLRYPIAYQRSALVIERDRDRRDKNASGHIEVYFQGKQDYDAAFVNEVKVDGVWRHQRGIRCLTAQPGIYEIRAEGALYETGRSQLLYAVWAAGAWDRTIEKAAVLNLTLESTRHREWDLGTVQISRGDGPEPMKVRVDIYDSPRLRP
jgi:hypothetical protein